MKEFEWRLAYAPFGYMTVKYRIDLAELCLARNPRLVLDSVMRNLHHEIGFSLNDCHTFLSVYPKDIGESINHLDPLKPRFGIEIEIRKPKPTQ